MQFEPTTTENAGYDVMPNGAAHLPDGDDRHAVAIQDPFEDGERACHANM